jgi:ABC-type transport system involved in multi-copper enzyme maturation permease subunit
VQLTPTGGLPGQGSTEYADTPPAQAGPSTAAASDRRRPTVLELLAGVLILACVVLHVVAMTQTYFRGEGTLASQPDQAVLFSVIAASWALVFVVGLFGPARLAIAAGLAVGVAGTELGFRVTDVGTALKLGSSAVGTGLWLMAAGWVVGAVGTVLLAISVSVRKSANPQARRRSADGRYERTAGWIAAVGALALATACLFLPPWDHYKLTATVTGNTKTVNLGNGLSGPWQIVVGNLIVVAALFVLPVVAIRMRRRSVGAAIVVGSLLILAAELASAVVQVDQPVSPASVGLDEGTARQLGVVITPTLTGWFALEAIAALVLVATILFWATARVDPPSSSSPL